MNQQMLAFTKLFRAAERVTCNSCGCDLTHTPNLPRLARKGCPQCGSKLFDYTYPPEIAKKVNTTLGGRLVRRTN